MPLQLAANDGSASLRVRARGLLRELDQLDWCAAVQKFADGLPEEDWRKGQLEWQTLESGALLLSSIDRMADERLPVATRAMAATLDRYARDLRNRIEGKSTLTAARLLSGYLAGRQGYGGSRSSFYSLQNINLDSVVEQRLGVPVALSLIYILVGRRAGLKVSGVAIPDHFLVRVHGQKPVLLDPYHEGRSVTKADCIRYLRRTGFGLHTSSYLEDVSDRQVLACLVRNLHRVYGYREDNDSCAVLERARQAIMGA